MTNIVSTHILVRSASASAHAQSQMKSWLIKELRQMRLVAIGRSENATQNGDLAVVPAHLFDPAYTDWAASKLSDGRRSYSEIRVLTADDLALAQASEPKPYKALGRPSKSDQVLNAIEGLITTGVDFKALGRGEAETKILAYAKDVMGADTRKGFSTPVIRRALVARCGRLSVMVLAQLTTRSLAIRLGVQNSKVGHRRRLRNVFPRAVRSGTHTPCSSFERGRCSSPAAWRHSSSLTPGSRSMGTALSASGYSDTSKYWKLRIRGNIQ